MKQAYLVTILSCLASTVTSQESLILPHPGETSPSLDTGSAYRQFACERGSPRSNVAFNCIKILDELRRTPADPISFGHRYWEDTTYGCHITAEANYHSERPPVLVRDLPADLLFLLYRCFLETRPHPARSASINAGTHGAYRIRIYPPRGEPDQDGAATLSPSAKSDPAPDPAIAPNASTSLATTKTSLGASVVRCSRKAPPIEAQFTECLPALMQIVNNPGSAVPLTWFGEDTKEWHTPLCRMSVSPRNPSKMAMAGDVFSERSLIDDALWIMGKCFAGPEAARHIISGWKAVGPLEQWKLTLTLGLPVAGEVESS
ncbi:MAG: hypothetical protein LQ343_000748 [Gyalolechia ehrenbergii]|nr:MAG: hypothetical protein LQ343_000748 [Gyalolechia ehrenbergii]